MKLEINHVIKYFGSKQALQDVSLMLREGVTGLLGPNGAGKSTLMRIIATVDRPSGGTVLLDGTDIVRRPGAMRRCLGYLPQDFGVYPNMNAAEFLQYMAAMKGLRASSARKRIEELLEVLHLKDAGKRMLGSYSGGMRQRVGIAQALLSDPSILIVDEPTVGLDPEERIAFRNLLSSLSSGRIIILSTHIVSDIESIAPSIAILNRGRLTGHTTPEEMIARVEGSVWQVVVDTAKFQQLQAVHAVSSGIQRSDGIHARVISAAKPGPLAQPVAPSLEDAYLYLTREEDR